MTRCSRSALVAATTRTSTRVGRVSPTGRISPCSRKRRNFGCTSIGRSPISSRKMRAAGRRADHARLIGDRAGEAAAPVPEQLAVGQLARRARAVVGQEHRRAARRPGVNRARDQVLAGAALAGDQHGEVAALQALDLIGDALHRRAGADEAGDQRLERRSMAPAAGSQRPLARRAQLEALAQHRAERAEPLQDRRRERPGPPPTAKRGAAAVATDRLDGEQRGRRRRQSARWPRRPARAPSRRRSRRTRRPARRRGRGCVKITAACASHASSSAVVPSFASSAGVTAASTMRRTSAASPSTCDAEERARRRRPARSRARRASRPDRGWRRSDSKIAIASVRYRVARDRAPAAPASFPSSR